MPHLKHCTLWRFVSIKVAEILTSCSALVVVAKRMPLVTMLTLLAQIGCQSFKKQKYSRGIRVIYHINPHMHNICSMVGVVASTTTRSAHVVGVHEISCKRVRSVSSRSICSELFIQPRCTYVISLQLSDGEFGWRSLPWI